MTKQIAYSFVLIAAAGTAYLAGSWRAPRETVSAAVVDDVETSRTILYYRCPMHPDVRSDHPGTAPCCGMAFEPLYADEAGAHAAASGTVAASAAQQQMIGVRTGAVAAAGGTDQIRAFGRVSADETRVFRITGGLEAYVSEMSAVTTGASVRKGQWLGSFATSDARVPVAAFISAVGVLEREESNGSGNPNALAAARGSVTLAEERLKTMGMSPLQMEDIRRERQQTTTLKVTSPVDGFLLARNVTPGQRFDAGTELFRLADLNRIWIFADVPVADGDRIKPGTSARVIVAGRETPVRARVSSQVLPQFDPATQSFKLRLEADNPGFVLRPDMSVDVAFEVSYEPALLVPADAVVFSGVSAHVFVERSAGVFEPREVEIGRRHGGRIAIVKGLAAGERIALSGTFLLDSESRMKANDRPHH